VIALVGGYTNGGGQDGFYALSYNGGSSYIYTTLNNPSGVNGTSLTGIDGSDSEVVGNYLDSNNISHGYVNLISLYTNFTWTGTGGNAWAGTSNWSVSGFAPNSTYNPVIFGPSAVTNSNLTLAATESVSNITFLSTQTYTISGGTLAIGPASGGVTLIAMESPGNLSISSALTLGGSQLTVQNSANSTLTISGTITSNNNSIFYDGSGGTFNLSGNFGGSGVINQASDGTLILSGTNTYSGGAALTSGTLDINSSTALGLGSGTFYIYSARWTTRAAPRSRSRTTMPSTLKAVSRLGGRTP
jgi:autotransporter-associated beta strand protein